MSDINELKDMLHDQAIDGGFTRNDAVIKKLEKLSKTEEELLVACYWIGFNARFEVEE
jgi:hypothetical protein